MTTLQAFLERHALDSWGLTVILSGAGLNTWRLDVAVVAPPEFEYSVRSNHVQVDRALDLAEVVEMCLETHYNACMNRRAMLMPRKSCQPYRPPQARAKAV